MVAAVWAHVVSPGARIALGPRRLVIELVIFAAGVAALLLRQQILLGVLLAVAYVVNKILMTIWTSERRVRPGDCAGGRGWWSTWAGAANRALVNPAPREYQRTVKPCREGRPVQDPRASLLRRYERPLAERRLPDGPYDRGGVEGQPRRRCGFQAENAARRLGGR
jgi:hypothetical protein